MTPFIRLCLPWFWLLLWPHTVSETGCPVAFLLMLPVVTLIALNMLESALLRRRAFVGMYLQAASSLYRLLRGGLLLMTWQVFKALAFGFLLCVESLGWPLWIWGLLMLDNLLLFIGYRWLLGAVSGQVKAAARPAIVRQTLLITHTALIALVVTLGQFFTPQTDYRGLSWEQVYTLGAEQPVVRCETLAPAVRLAETKNALAWWAVETWSERMQYATPLITAAVWLLFLFTTTVFLWAYHRLTLAMLIDPFKLFER